MLTFGVFETASFDTNESSKKLSHGMEVYLCTARGEEPWSPHRGRREKDKTLLLDLDRFLSTLERGHRGADSSASRL